MKTVFALIATLFFCVALPHSAEEKTSDTPLGVWVPNFKIWMPTPVMLFEQMQDTTPAPQPTPQVLLPRPRPPEASAPRSVSIGKAVHEMPPVRTRARDWDNIHKPKERLQRVATKLSLLCSVYLRGVYATGKYTSEVNEFVMTHDEAQSVAKAQTLCPGASTKVVTSRQD